MIKLRHDVTKALSARAMREGLGWSDLAHVLLERRFANDLDGDIITHARAQRSKNPEHTVREGPVALRLQAHLSPLIAAVARDQHLTPGALLNSLLSDELSREASRQ
jgi:hypothetical protein